MGWRQVRDGMLGYNADEGNAYINVKLSQCGYRGAYRHRSYLCDELRRLGDVRLVGPLPVAPNTSYSWSVEVSNDCAHAAVTGGTFSTGVMATHSATWAILTAMASATTSMMTTTTTVTDAGDSDAYNAYECIDSDGDGCDDCSVAGSFAPNNDGTDTDSDGACDTGDLCPSDADKTLPGGCGCGVEDTDTCGWSAFGAWSGWSTECGEATRTRSRTERMRLLRARRLRQRRAFKATTPAVGASGMGDWSTECGTANRSRTRTCSGESLRRVGHGYRDR